MLFKDMTDDDLRAAYVGWRTASYNAGKMANSIRQPKSRNGRNVAASWGRAIRNVEIIEAIAKKRGIKL